MRDYELVYILDPDLTEESVSALMERFKTLAENQGADIKSHERWEKRRLAYEIKRKREGTYVVMELTASPAAVHEMDRILKITDGLLRHQIVRAEAFRSTELPRTPEAIVAPAPTPEPVAPEAATEPTVEATATAAPESTAAAAATPDDAVSAEPVATEAVTAEPVAVEEAVAVPVAAETVAAEPVAAEVAAPEPVAADPAPAPANESDAE